MNSLTVRNDYIEVVKDIAQNTRDIRTRIAKIKEKISDEEFSTDNGVSLLDAKHQMLLSYLSHLSYYILLRLSASPVENHPVIDKLLENRVFLEKIKPLELKIKYQIEKLVKSADMEQGKIENINDESANPLAFKPNPMALEQEDDAQPHQEEDGVYKPPKLAPMFFDEAPKTKKGRLTAHQREKASRSRLLNELRAQYDDRPEEQTAEGTGYGAHEIGNEFDEKWKERERFEEENMVRLNMTREDKKLRKHLEKRASTTRFQNDFEVTRTICSNCRISRQTFRIFMHFLEQLIKMRSMILEWVSYVKRILQSQEHSLVANIKMLVSWFRQ
jgi:hypothetical protein